MTFTSILTFRLINKLLINTIDTMAGSERNAEPKCSFASGSATKYIIGLDIV